jgi:hypothetical protein
MSADWQLWFAWHPVTTLSGRRVWWTHVRRRWNPDAGSCVGDFSGYTHPAGAWEYSMPLRARINANPKPPL